MQYGLTKKTLGVLVGAALLSGSAFAAGPTLTNLPNVVITDRNNPATSASAYDLDTSVTENRYRFTAAFRLKDYVNYGDNSDSAKGTVNYLFRELDFSFQPVGTHTIEINGDSPVSTIPTYDDLVNSSFGDVVSAGALDFINVNQSVNNGNTADSIPRAPFTDTTTIEMFVASTEVQDEIDFQTFSVITTNDVDPLDDHIEFSTGVSILTPEICITDFAGWYPMTENIYVDFTQVPPLTLATFDVQYEAAAPQYSPSASDTGSTNDFLGNPFGVFPAGTTTLTGTTQASPTIIEASGAFGDLLAPQFVGFLSWRRDLSIKTTINTTAGRIYMARWTMSDDSVTTAANAPQVPQVRFRLGESTDYGSGVAYDGFSYNGANSIALDNGTRTHRSYYYAHANGEIGFGYDMADYFNGASANIGLIYPNGHRDYGLSLHSVEVFSFDRADLTDEQVEFNQGESSATITLAGGQPTPPGGAVNYDATAWEGPLRVFQESGTTRPITMTNGGDVLSIDLSQGDSAVTAQWDTYKYAASPLIIAGGLDNGTEIVSAVPNDRLIIMDTWLSSPDAAVSSNTLPVVRIGLTTDVWGESGSTAPQILQGRFSFFQFRGSNYINEHVGVQVPADIALETGARRYSVIMEPQIQNFNTIDVRPQIDITTYPLFARTDFTATNLNTAFDEGQLDINRVVISTYQLPADFESAPCN